MGIKGREDCALVKRYLATNIGKKNSLSIPLTEEIIISSVSFDILNGDAMLGLKIGF